MSYKANDNEIAAASRLPAAEHWIYLFHGIRGAFPGGAFSTRALAEEWIARNRLSGLLSEYPVDIGVYDWGIRAGLVRKPRSGDYGADIIGGFSSALDHWHYENGERVG